MPTIALPKFNFAHPVLELRLNRLLCGFLLFLVTLVLESELALGVFAMKLVN